MNDGEIFLLLIALSFVAQLGGAIYGDYLSTGKWPWTKPKKGVNSGAKFG